MGSGTIAASHLLPHLHRVAQQAQPHDVTYYALVALAGLIVGTLTGLTGVGGGSLVTPLLVLLLHISPTIAVGTDLLYSVPTKLLGATVHHRQGTVNWRLVRYLVTGGVPGAIAGLILLAYLQTHLSVTAVNAAIKHSLGITLVCVAAAIIVKPLLSHIMKSTPSATVDWTSGAVARVVTLGLLVGFIVSLTSIGSGALTMPMLFFLVPQIGLRRLVGSDVAFSAILIPVAAIGFLHMGNVNLALAGSLLIGSLPGIVIGSKLVMRIPDTWVRPALAVCVGVAGLKLI